MRNLPTTLILLLVLIFVAIPMPAQAFSIFGSVCNAKDTQVQNSSLCQGQGDPTQNPLIGKDGLIMRIATILAVATGIAAVIVIIVGGVRYITSGGDPAQTKAAKDSIIAGIIGLAIIVAAGSIIGLVVSRL